MIKKKRRKSFTTVQVIALGFLCAILLGTFLLMLPVSSAEGNWTAPITALFTATSSVCVTGLVVVDTYAHWSIFGQVVILILIQFGGLGIVTFTTLLAWMLGRKMSLKDVILIEDAFNLSSLTGVVRFLKRVVLGTVVVEAVGALLYMIVFVPQFGAKGVWISIFNSVSAFCNAGMDIIGNSSLMEYAAHPLVNFITIGLIVIGGIGFIVWWDCIRVAGLVKKKNIKMRHCLQRLRLHSKIVLVTTGILIVSGTLLVMILEYNNPMTIGTMTFENKLMASLFQSVTLRTAGFCTIPQAELRSATAVICMLYMFIGGSPVGTAGGIKTVTFAVIMIAVKATIDGRDDGVAFGRTIPLANIRRALSVAVISVLVTITAIILISMVTDVGLLNGAYETVSAVGTVGLSRNTTALLNLPGKIIIILCMYLGRIGPISMAIALIKRNKRKFAVTYPPEEVTVG